MDTQHLHCFLASVPGSAGERLSWAAAVNMLAAGNPVAAGSLVQLIGVDVIPALVEAGAPAPALMAAIDAAVILRYRELPGLIARHGGRAGFVDWCLMAGYTPPLDWPPVVTLYRGTLGVAPAVAASGLHWSRRFDSAAAFAARVADDDLTGAIIVQALVPRSRIACFVSDSTHDEVIPDEAPTEFSVITGKERILPAAYREVARQERLQAQFGPPQTYAADKQAGMAARARMVAAGVLPGTAIVA